VTAAGALGWLAGEQDGAEHVTVLAWTPAAGLCGTGHRGVGRVRGPHQPDDGLTGWLAAARPVGILNDTPFLPWALAEVVAAAEAAGAPVRWLRCPTHRCPRCRSRAVTVVCCPDELALCLAAACGWSGDEVQALDPPTADELLLAGNRDAQTAVLGDPRIGPILAVVEQAVATPGTDPHAIIGWARAALRRAGLPAAARAAALCALAEVST